MARNRRIPSHPRLHAFMRWSASSLNFYRIHLLFFLFTPLIVATIFYGVGTGDTHVDFIDALFMCVSAITVTGLNTVPFAQLNVGQQIILFCLQSIGSSACVSLITIVIRLHFFRQKFKHLAQGRKNVSSGSLDNTAPNYDADLSPSETKTNLSQRLLKPIKFAQRKFETWNSTPDRISTLLEKGGQSKSKKKSEAVSTDMIKRVDEPVRVNKMNNGGYITESESVPAEQQQQQNQSTFDSLDTAANGDLSSPNRADDYSTSVPKVNTGKDREHQQQHEVTPHKHHIRRASWNVGPRQLPESPLNVRRFQTQASQNPQNSFAETAEGHSFSHDLDTNNLRKRALLNSNERLSKSKQSMSSLTQRRQSTMERGFGGFPNPITYVAQFARNRIPTIDRTLTVPRRSTTITSIGPSPTMDGSSRQVPYISFEARVGRNSVFHNLTNEQADELGGIEYRALSLLLKIVATYLIGLPIFAIIIVIPYVYKVESVRSIVSGPGVLNPAWFAVFNSVSAFSNCGMSAIDSSLTEFIDVYYVSLIFGFLILAGNTCFPIFLRFSIWSLSKLVPSSSRTHETLRFLLDHPRRCFIYLFPSYQTWFLVFVVTCLTMADFVSALVLDIGNPPIEAIPVGERVFGSFIQAICVRNAGFSILPLSSVAPAVQFLYLIMMYIAVFPIAISIRSTNVYEEKSMGIFEEEEEDEDEIEESFSKKPGSYIAHHARKQLAFDIWWLAFALVLICIIERHNITDVNSLSWFSVFAIMFEVASGYGTVGLSLGAPSGTSLSGAFRTLSKLVQCVVMIRGRHRGLPIAIDRAILLPSDIRTLDPLPLNSAYGNFDNARTDEVLKSMDPSAEVKEVMDEPNPIVVEQEQVKSIEGSPRRSMSSDKIRSAPGTSISFALPPELPRKEHYDALNESAIVEDDDSEPDNSGKQVQKQA